jgi:hypothetical protein
MVQPAGDSLFDLPCVSVGGSPVSGGRVGRCAGRRYAIRNKLPFAVLILPLVFACSNDERDPVGDSGAMPGVSLERDGGQPGNSTDGNSTDGKGNGNGKGNGTGKGKERDGGMPEDPDGKGRGPRDGGRG